MDDEVMLDAGVVTRCRRRVHLEHDESMREMPKAPADPGIEQRIADAAEHREHVARRLSELLPDWTEIPRDASVRLREESTSAAMTEGISYISNAQLPTDREGNRRGQVDLLVRTGGGYTPVLVVRHKITDPGKGARTSPLHRPLPEAAGHSDRYKTRAHPRDQLKLAHAQRMLQAGGHASSNEFGGVIGVDVEYVLWHDLTAPTWPGGRSALEEYDARFDDRVAVATAAATGAEPLAWPSRINECKHCPWWPTCELRLRSTRDVSLVVRGEDANLLRQAGVTTVDALAELGGETAESIPLALGRTNDAVLMAKAWLRDLPLVRRVRDASVPRADVEIDVDMESYADAGAYMWGCYLSGVDIGERQGYRAFATWDPLPSDDEARSFAEFWTWFRSVRERAHERGLTFRAYCYNELAENRWMLSSASRFAGKPGMPSVSEVRGFINSDEWVDLFAIVRDQFLCPNGKGLKVIAPTAGFAWRDDEASGENSMRWYRDAVGLDNLPMIDSQRERLLRYNEDDVRATFTVREWMSSAALESVPHVDDL